MNPRRQPARSARSIAKSLRVAVCSVAVVGLVTAVIAHDFGLRRQHALHRRERLTSIATVAAARAAALGTARGSNDEDVISALSNEAPAARDAVREIAAAVVGLNQVDAVALTDAAGRVVFRWPQTTRARDTISVPHDPSEPAWVAINVARGIVMDGAAVPIRDGRAAKEIGYLCVFSASEGVGASQWSSLALFAGVVGGVSVVCVVLALRYLNRRVCVPIAQIATSRPDEQVLLPVDRVDEFGMIARQLEQLTNDLDQARTDANRLERSLETTVQRETRQISNQLRRAERAAEVDALTGLANRRFIEQRLEAVYSEQLARGVNLAIAMFDVDNFKTLNDAAGHAAGDALLRFIGELLAGTLREHDVGVRFGGDEFALLLVDVTGRQAHNIAERTIKLFARQTAAAKLPAPVTLSAGIASLDEVNVRSGAELMARADDALYESKHKGKNLAIAATD